MTPQIKLLILSPDRTALRALRGALNADFEVFTVSEREAAERLMGEVDPDVAIVDLGSDPESMVMLLDFVKNSQNHPAPVVLMADDEQRYRAMELVGNGVYDYFRKPPHLGELKIVVGRAAEHRRLKQNLRSVRAEPAIETGCDRLLGSSSEMRAVYDMIRCVADIDANVVIRGESGTGKELVARAIHNIGARADRRFIPIACGAIPETLIETELFGHARGAFTGASAQREGYFERVGDGTLLLDEAGEMSQNTQVKLLRVLQEREFTRVGGNGNHALEARVLFATHRNLEQMVASGEFREDLYYRMHVVKIEIPPLRRRKEDIPTLAQSFVATCSRAYGNPNLEIAPAALRALMEHHWPGNVRELENVIQRSAILSSSGTIGADEIRATLSEAALQTGEVRISDETFEEQVKHFKYRLIEESLKATKGNKTMAAKRLGITRAYLHRILGRAQLSDSYRNGVSNDQRAS